MTATTLPTSPDGARVGASPTAPAQPHRGRFRLCVAALLWVLPLLVLGAMTTSTGSGMAFADWPLANGQLWPEMQLDGYLEHVHRFAGGGLGVLVLWLAIWSVARDPVRWRRWLTITLLGIVVVQGLIGGIGVLHNTPVLSSATHGVLAQAVVALLVFAAFAYSPAWSRAPLELQPDIARKARKMTKVALVCLFLQLGLGSLGRHGAADGYRWALWVHVTFSLVVSVMVLISCAYTGAKVAGAPGTAAGAHRAGLKAGVRWAMILLITQMTLGMFTLALRSDKDPSNIERLGAAGVVSGHVVVGAALLCTMALLVYRLHRSVVPAANQVEHEAPHGGPARSTVP